jgi:hypothetical protein
MPSIGSTGKEGRSRQIGEECDAGNTSHNAGTSYCKWRMKAGQGGSGIKKRKEKWRDGILAFTMYGVLLRTVPESG